MPKDNEVLVLHHEYKEENGKKFKNLSVDKLEKQYYSLLEREIKLKNNILQQNTKDIKSLNGENIVLNKKILEIQKSNKQLLKDNEKLNNGYKNTFTELNKYKNDDHLKAQSEFIYKQQSLVKQYENEITKLQKLNREDNEKLAILEKENTNLRNKEKENKDKEMANINHSEKENQKLIKQSINDANEKIKYYQDDNLRLSNEVSDLTKKLENSKKQLEEFENNTSKIQEEINSLNNIISKNNVVKDQFMNVSQNENRDVEKKSKKKTDLNLINSLTKDIFKN